jgi:hypothetical protein
MVITSFSFGPVDLGQQPYKPHEIACSVDRFRFAHGQSAQAAELRNQVIVQGRSGGDHTANMGAIRAALIAGWVAENSAVKLLNEGEGFGGGDLSKSCPARKNPFCSMK